jgi:ribonuclease HII
MPDFSIELELQNEGFSPVAGVDEAGRGPLAGPVVAAAAILPEGFSVVGLDDSKKLSAKRREQLYQEITAAGSGVVWASGQVDAGGIDEINILQATYRAMALAANALKQEPAIAIIDGRPVKNFPFPHRAVVKGDSKSLSVAAASIIAKVERDRIMMAFSERYPQYGFERHKGYGTKLHLEALNTHGPCPIHRHSFAPVAASAGRAGA